MAGLHESRVGAGVGNEGKDTKRRLGWVQGAGKGRAKRKEDRKVGSEKGELNAERLEVLEPNPLSGALDLCLNLISLLLTSVERSFLPCASVCLSVRWI